MEYVTFSGFSSIFKSAVKDENELQLAVSVPKPLLAPPNLIER